MNILYVVPNLNKVSGGPRTRISMFKNVFRENGGLVIEGKSKLGLILNPKKFDMVYVESATNRISLVDVICLLFLRLRSKEVKIFIRDIYIEFFPHEYRTLRKKLTLIFNKLSNFYLTLISTSMAFPTLEMGEVFFERNKMFPKRNYIDLPPATIGQNSEIKIPDFDKKFGILYLGSTQYLNGGFERFIDFSRKFHKDYNFHVLSSELGLQAKLANENILFNSVPHSEIKNYIEAHNIAFAVHTRPRNAYDDVTFPIKVLDFIGLKLPFFSENHLPLVRLLGDDYELFCNIDNLDSLQNKIMNISKVEYVGLTRTLANIAIKNTYHERYKKLISN